MNMRAYINYVFKKRIDKIEPMLIHLGLGAPKFNDLSSVK